MTLLIQIEANRIYTIISQKIQYQILSDNKSLLMTNNFHKEVCFVSIPYYIFLLFKGTTLTESVTSNPITTEEDWNCSCKTLQDCSNCEDNEEDE